MSIFRNKYKITCVYIGSAFAYTLYVRSWRFMFFPYWMRLNDQPVSAAVAGASLASQFKLDAELAAKYSRMK